MKNIIIFIFTLFLAQASHAAPLPVVASFSIIGDMVKTIGGEDVTVTTIVGHDADSHAYRKLANAKIIFINGLGFEGWMNKLTKSAGYTGDVITVSQGIKPIHIEEATHDHDHGHHHEEFDPHAWQSVDNTRIYVKNIAATLVKALPEKAKDIKARAAAYDAELAKLDADIKTAFKDIPAEKRKVITSHDAFGYFGADYGITFLAPEGLNTDSEPSAADVAKLINQIKTEKVKTVFLENMSSPRLISQIAKDTGATIGGTLYADALSTSANTYIDMMRANLALIQSSLQGQ
jgi:zinc/manganese transport system substrate-binding protein